MGGRKSMSSLYLGLDSQLTLEYSHLSGKRLGMADLDATACYDLIIRTIEMIALMLYGIKQLAKKLMMQTLANFKY